MNIFFDYIKIFTAFFMENEYESKDYLIALLLVLTKEQAVGSDFLSALKGFLCKLLNVL